MLVDTTVLLDVLQNDPDGADASVAQLRAQAQIHRLVINPIIYAELSLAFSTMQALDQALAALQIAVVDIPAPALFLAGKAFAKYLSPDDTLGLRLSDFFIGAHAAVAGVPVLTRDAHKLAWYFPTVAWLAPTQTSP